ncbi:hypothetical protein [Microbispora rosea]|nr:hypothetical protein [Microbispora rosea]
MQGSPPVMADGELENLPYPPARPHRSARVGDSARSRRSCGHDTTIAGFP